MDEQRKWFLEIESSPSEDTVKNVKMTTRDLEYYINLTDKTVKRFDSNFFFIIDTTRAVSHFPPLGHPPPPATHSQPSLCRCLRAWAVHICICVPWLHVTTPENPCKEIRLTDGSGKKRTAAQCGA